MRSAANGPTSDDRYGSVRHVFGSVTRSELCTTPTYLVVASQPFVMYRADSQFTCGVLGNSDNQRGAQMSLQQFARDDEEIRCVSPQRVVSASSRVVPFRSVTMSDADRLHRLKEIDPEAHAMIMRRITALTVAR